MYKPKITTTDRNGEKAVWVNMPDDESYNIWDLSKLECSRDTLKAISHAFRLGYVAARMMLSQSLSNVVVEVEKEES